MGATFIGLADDATASEANPAGLVILNRPEVSAHFRFSSSTNDFPNTVTGSGIGSFSDKATSPSFFSFVYPLRGAAVSVYYQQSGNFESHSQFVHKVPSFEDITDLDISSSSYLLENLGGSGGVKIGKYLSVGASVRYTRVRLNYNTTSLFNRCRFGDIVDENGNVVEKDVCLAVDRSIKIERLSDDSDSQITYNAGILVNPNGKVSAGFVYKKGAEFGIVSEEAIRVAFPASGLEISRDLQIDQTFKVPSSYGGGVAYRPRQNWILAADVVRITYSDLSTTIVDQTTGLDQFLAVKDGTEFHAGGEYTLFFGSTPFSVRAGLFSDPDHDLFQQLDSSALHGTFGGGIVIKNSLQIDMAFNFSRNTKETLFSVVQRF